MASIKSNFIYNSFLMVSNYLINLILFPYCARVLGVERFGTINFAQNIIQYFLFIAMMGITHIGVREIAKQSSTEDRNSTFSSLFALNLIYTLIALAIYLPLVFFVDRFWDQKSLFLLGSLQILFTTFTIEWYFRGTEDFRYITLRNVGIKVAFLISVFCLVRKPDDYILFFFLTVLMTLVNAIVNYWYAQKSVHFSLKRLRLGLYLKSSLSLGAYSILTSMYTTFNVAFLGFIWNDIQVGYYTTSLKLYTVILGFYSAFTGVMLPRMTSINESGDKASFSGLIEKSFELLYTIAMPLVMVLFVFAPELVALFAGKGYEPAIDMSRIVIPMLLVVGIAQILSFQVLIPKGYDKVTLYASIIGALVGVSANCFLTIKMAAIGTCFCVVITECCVTAYYLYVVHAKKLIHFNTKKIMLHFITSLPYAVICYILQNYFSNSYIFELCSAFMLCGLYFVLSQYFIIRNQLVRVFVLNLFK